jgi:hypothetical protein
METLYLTKKYLEFEVTYHQGRVQVIPVHYPVELEQSAEMIARSEQLLSLEHLELMHSNTPLKDLAAYFQHRGWEVIQVHRTQWLTFTP